MNKYMNNHTIRILDSDQVEKTHFINNINLTYDIWTNYITPWEHRKIFRDFKLIYHIGNKKDTSDNILNYNQIKQKINEINDLWKAHHHLSFAKIINTHNYYLCDDIITKIIYYI